MDALDKLKGAWKAQDYTSDKVSTNDIYKMLHAKSSSYVKWIFYISVIELGLGLLVNFISYFNGSLDKSTELIKDSGYYNYYLFVTYLSIGVVIYFIFKFYKMFKRIEVSANVKTLMNTILTSRKVVKQYIYFNLIFAFIIIESFLIYGMLNGYSKIAIEKGLSAEISIRTYVLGGLFAIIIGVILVGVFWVIYYLLYGILLKRLKKNYKELEQNSY